MILSKIIITTQPVSWWTIKVRLFQKSTTVKKKLPQRAQSPLERIRPCHNDEISL